MKIRPVSAELFQADEETDRMQLIVAFRNFATALKNVNLFLIYVCTFYLTEKLPNF
jgi:hypothetical protein